jgi:hypothetical protein
MAEIWGAAIAIGGAAISAYGKNKSEKEARKDAKAATKDEAKYQGILSQFEKEQDYYYNQLERKNRVRGLDQFKQFSRIGALAPEYKAADTTPIVPVKPDIDKMLNPEGTGTGGGGGSGGKITDKIAKLDPLTGKINKALGIKF